GLQAAAVSRVESIIDDLRDEIARRVSEAGGDDEEELQQEE
ncbi:terminase, partial [Escherichia coli]